MRGLQGAGVPIAACVKHWVADGGTVLGSGTADFAWTGAPYLPISPHISPVPPLYLHCISSVSRRLRVDGRAARHALDPSRSNPSRSTLSRSTVPAEQRAHAPRRPAGAPAHVLDQGDVQCGEAELREVHVAPYLPALEAGCLTVMASYSSVHGAKVH